MGKSDEQIQRMGYEIPPPPKTGIAKVLESLKSGKETMDNLPYNPNKLLPNPSEMVSGMARGGVETL